MKKITLEKLATMVQNGFEEVLETTAKKTDLEKIEQRLGSVERRLDEYLEEIRLIKKRLDVIERKLDNIVYQTEFFELKNRVEFLEKRLQKILK